MADDIQVASEEIGELRGKVDSLDKGFIDIRETVGKLGEQFTDGFNRLFTMIREGNDKTDRRIDALQQESQQSAASRTNTWLTVLNMVSSGMLGVGTLTIAAGGFVVGLYTIIKVPIDDTFRRHDLLLEKMEKHQEAYEKEQRQENASLSVRFIPRDEAQKDLDNLKEETQSDTRRIVELEKFAAVSVNDRVAIRAERDLKFEAVNKQINAIVKEIDLLRGTVTGNIVNRSEAEARLNDIKTAIMAVNKRIDNMGDNLMQGNTIGDRMNRIQKWVDEIQSLLTIKNLGK